MTGSTIHFKSMAVYRKTGKPGAPTSFIEALHGASAGRFAEDGQVELLVGNVPLNTKALRARAPKDGVALLMLYGHHDAISELCAWRKRADELDAEFAVVDYEVEVGRIEVKSVTHETLLDQSVRFANVRRMTSAVQLDLLALFATYVEEEGGNPTRSMAHPIQMATRPDLFVRALREAKLLRHLDAMVIPVADDPQVPGRIRQVAVISPRARVVSARSTGDVRFLLPSWMSASQAVAA